jgi:hypothetical protein
MFWGVSKDHWEIINGFANWLAAVGTITAVAVSLYLARKGSRPKAKLSVLPTVIVTIGAGYAENRQHYLDMRVVNSGDREFKVVAVGWRMGIKGKRKFFMQNFSFDVSSPLPIRLAHGDSATWRVLVADGQGWYATIADHFESSWRAELQSLRFIVSTSIGDEFVCCPDKKIISRLHEELVSLHGPSSFLISLKKKVAGCFKS